MPTIPTALAALLPFAATLLSSWLNDDSLKPGTNALIALCALLFTATGCELLTVGLIPHNPAATFLGVLAYVTILMQGDLSVLYGYLIAQPSPAIKRAPAPPPAPPPPPQTNVPA